MPVQTNQRIDGRRLWDSLMGMAEIGATPKGGVRRLTLTDVDRRGRERFRAECEAAGLVVRIDEIGNMFARRQGRDPARPPVLFGSHLDSQPSGGKFDGALGVLAGLEVVRTLNDLGIVTEAPLELVNWTDEEGSRFGHSLMGSGVWSGVYPLDKAYALTDTEGVTVRRALDGIGYHGPEKAAAFPADAYFELHIEQGPILENEAKQIGIVTGAQAQVWYDAVATGQDSHAGTTPPSARRDALVCAARIIDLVDRMMRARGENGRGTVGQLLVSPNSRNVIPGEVRFSVEFRHPDGAEVDRLDAQFPREAGLHRPRLRREAGIVEAVQHPGPAIRPGVCGTRAAGCGEAGLQRAGDRLRCRPRRGVCRAARADRDDLHAVQGRAVAQRGGEHRARGSRSRRPGVVRGRAGAGEPGRWTEAWPRVSASGRRQDTLRQLVVRAVDHLAVERQDAGVRIGREGLIDPFRPAHPLRRGGEGGIHDVDLGRVDQDLAGEAVRRSGFGLPPQPVGVPRIRKGRVDRGDPDRAGGHQHLGSREDDRERCMSRRDGAG